MKGLKRKLALSWKGQSVVMHVEAESEADKPTLQIGVDLDTPVLRQRVFGSVAEVQRFAGAMSAAIQELLSVSEKAQAVIDLASADVGKAPGPTPTALADVAALDTAELTR